MEEERKKHPSRGIREKAQPFIHSVMSVFLENFVSVLSSVLQQEKKIFSHCSYSRLVSSRYQK